MNSRVRKLEARISELQRSNDDFLHLKVKFNLKKIRLKISQTRAENTVREQKIRIDSLTAEQQRMLSENAQSREVKEEMNRQNKK